MTNINGFFVCDDCTGITCRNSCPCCDICSNSICCNDCIRYHTFLHEKFIILLCENCEPRKQIKKVVMSYRRNPEYLKELAIFRDKIKGRELTTRNIKNYANPIPLDEESSDIHCMPVLEKL